MPEIILDAGSNHMGDMDHAKDLIIEAYLSGASKIKFQLIPQNKVGANQYLPFEWFPELVASGKQIGIEVFASVWSQGGMEICSVAGCRSIKFAFSQRKSERIPVAYENFEKVYVSTDFLDPICGDKLVKLWCIPEYPVPYQVAFDDIFPYMDGFSDHTLGINQAIRALDAGCQVIEKHFKLGLPYETCPDSRFAITPKEAKILCQYARTI